MKTLLDMIKGFEGYTPKAEWDHKQYSVGYGTRATSPGETITPDEAERRLQVEVGKARGLVEAFAPNAPEGVKAALTSLTYNSGTDWMNSGLGNEIKAGNYDGAKDNFLAYNKASGQFNQGLANRRAQEVAWFDGGMPLGGPSEARGGSMNGGYGMSPVGTAGIAGPIHTANPAPIQSQFADLKGPEAGTAVAASGGWGSGNNPDFNAANIADAIMNFGESVNKWLPKPERPRVEMADAFSPKPRFATAAEVLQSRRKWGNRGPSGRGLT